MTFAEAFQSYLTSKPRAKTTIQLYTDTFKRTFASLGDREFSTVTRAELCACIRAQHQRARLRRHARSEGRGSAWVSAVMATAIYNHLDSIGMLPPGGHQACFLATHIGSIIEGRVPDQFERAPRGQSGYLRNRLGTT